ncbi:hypothetical protein VIBNISOn1_1840009 [Vibrio nigripulchritudo SOn1]|uniref:Uncharacterized protein n=1 Tax=Vibrio nigripulchritudo SOn1 TaxID=1238450 RepID=A0AAV2VPM7_9VIBR|nr:hypothetical protein [Vibrio nigripulchritudo]CCO46626.1 hypothetical protein VIBNISOn1_1840009 [Vibrio nigripulchritudo SOn1]
MALKGQESVMAENIMNALEAAGFKPRAQEAVGAKFWTAVSKGIIDTIVSESEVEVKGGGSYGGEMAKVK